jgi:hypothetical protein
MGAFRDGSGDGFSASVLIAVFPEVGRDQLGGA